MSAERVRDILAEVKRPAAEHHQLTGKPLGVTGEIAGYVAAEVLGLELAPPRTPGYDALRPPPSGTERMQVKGCVHNPTTGARQRISHIRHDAPCDAVLLVLPDDSTLDPREMREAPFGKVAARRVIPGSKARERGALGVNESKRMAQRIWPK